MTFALDLRNRDALFSRLASEVFDVLVIGAGITGAGIARDAAMRGLKAVLVDARDFAAGTSSRSTKLVHGGIRYLAQGDIGLVREAATERATVRRIAPHLAHPMPFIVTTRSRAAVLKFRAGLWAYERLGSVSADDRHEVWDAAELAANEPLIRMDGISGAVVYSEYLTDDARLTVANVRHAAEHGAVVANYAAVTGLVPVNGRAVAARVADTLSEGRNVEVRARTIVNAAGPWADRLIHLEDARAPKRLQLTEGIHIVVPHAKLPITRTLVMSAQDGRGVFAIPRAENVYIGTTDTFYANADYWPDVRPDDVRYLLATTNASFTTPPLSLRDITSIWSGLRPLVAEANKSPSEISRKDETNIGPLGMITIAGGKLTAYRRMAERVVDLCVRTLGARARPVATASTPLPGGDFAGGVDELTADLCRRGVARGVAATCVARYGAEAEDVLALGAGPEAEAEWAVRYEGAVQLEDWWVRRSARAWFDQDGGIAALVPAAARMATLLGWSDAVRTQQIDKCRQLRRATMAALEPLAQRESACKENGQR
jgi:glycerol-3-phosphate dehydrogenase